MTYVDQAPLHGIKLHRYEAVHTSFSNSSEYPPNAGYYAYNYKYGVVNLTAISFQSVCYSMVAFTLAVLWLLSV